MSEIRKRPIACINSQPVVAGLFRIINESDVKFSAVAELAGFHTSTLYDWGRRQNPSVANLEAVLNVLGYTLTITKNTPGY